MKVVKYMLINEIKVSDIQINQDAKDLREAIQKSSVPLI